MPTPNRRMTNFEVYEFMATAEPFAKIIRSAIIIESEIEEIFNRAFLDPAPLAKMKMTYAQKVELVLAIGLQERLGPPLRALAKIRNDFAHKLDAEFSPDRASNFFATFDKSDQKLIRENYAALERIEGPHDYAALDQYEQFVICVVTLRGALRAAQEQTKQLLGG